MNHRALGPVLMTLEEPVDLQFFDWKHVSEETYLELKAMKPCRARTLRGFAAKDSMGWEDFLGQSHRDGAELKAGAIIPMAGAGGETQLAKEPGDTVNFNVKIMNMGVEAVNYFVKVMYAERGVDEWELADVEDCRLEPMAHMYVEMGGLELSEEMAGKYYDALFQLIDVETGTFLDEVVVEKAWYVEEPTATGIIIEKWVY